MHDPHYRLSVAWQNVAYNQPPHTGFYLGHDMSPPPRPAIRTIRANLRHRRPVALAASLARRVRLALR